MKCISISLYGTGPKYMVGAVANALLALKFYPGWQTHVWTGIDVPSEVVRLLKAAGSILHSAPSTIANGMFWRFLAHDLYEVERYIVRDADSRFSEREIKAVNEWIVAGTQLHVMRDHPVYHNQLVMGGLWGWRKLPNDFVMSALIFPWCNTVRFGQDQDFLAAEVWPRAKSRTVHDVRTNWPPEGESFCGEYVDQSGQTNQEHRRMRYGHPKIACHLVT